MPKKMLILVLILYVVSTAATYGAFALMSNKSSVSLTSDEVINEDEESALAKLLNIDPQEPKDQPCPLNGKLYTQTEKAAWEKRRPLGIMIENTPDARPQSGLGAADVVFEAVAEGGVTRFLSMYYCGVQVQDTLVAPVRSARIYYMEIAAGFNRPLYVHVGGANVPGPTDALGILSDWGWTAANDLNQFSIGYPTFWRDYNRIEGKEVATEHTMVSSTEKLWAVGEKRKWTNMSPDIKRGKTVIPGSDWLSGFTPWQFQDGQAAASANDISYEFWTGFDQYAVRWVYNPQANSYKRFNAGEPHIDLNNNQQVEAKNVVVFLTTEKGPINEKKHMQYTIVGTGDALVFQNGQVVNATWSKKDTTSQIVFKDDKGKEIQFVRGLTWVSVVDKSTKVSY